MKIFLLSQVTHCVVIEYVFFIRTLTTVAIKQTIGAMGVPGLRKFLHEGGCFQQLSFHCKSPRIVVVVDGLSLTRRVFGNSAHNGDWLRGLCGRQVRIGVSQFVRSLRRCGIEPVVVIDGGVSREKEHEWKSRRRVDARVIEKQYFAVTGQSLCPKSCASTRNEGEDSHTNSSCELHSTDNSGNEQETLEFSDDNDANEEVDCLAAINTQIGVAEVDDEDQDYETLEIDDTDQTCEVVFLSLTGA